MSSLWRRISAREEGVTLVELMITTLILSLVVASMLTFFGSLQRTAAREASRSEATDAIRVAMDRMTKDIRQAIDIRAGSGAAFIDMDTFIDGVQHRIAYDASVGNKLTRRIDGGTATTMLERLTSTALFVYAPDALDPSVITVTLVARPEKFSQDVSDVTLTSEVKLRNR